MATILGIGGWRGPGFTYYLSLREEEEVAAIRDLARPIDGGGARFF